MSAADQNKMYSENKKTAILKGKLKKKKTLKT
jgi:hypothetical protein